MHRIFFVLLAAPFWLQFVFAGALIYFGYSSQQSAETRYAQQAQLLEATPPQTIAIGDFSGKYDHKSPQEVSITAQVALDHNTRLIRKSNFITTGEDILYVLVDPDAPAGETVARAAIILDPDQKDQFADWAMENMISFAGAGPVVTVNGLLDGGTQVSMVYDALKEQGMVRGPNFFYITPYLDGREAALALKPSAAMDHAMPFYYAALFFALLGVAKLLYNRNAPSGAAKGNIAPDLRPITRPGTPVLPQDTPDFVHQFISDDATRARIEAAMTNPMIAMADIGQTKLAATMPERFTVPDPVYTPRARPSAIVTTPGLGERIRLAVAASSAPKIVAYAGFAVLLLIIMRMMVGAPGSFGQKPSVDDNVALGKVVLPLLGGLIVVLLVFKNLAAKATVSKRKEIYDPYLRLAQRERLQKDHG